jgi:hypothetical protein
LDRFERYCNSAKQILWLHILISFIRLVAFPLTLLEISAAFSGIIVKVLIVVVHHMLHQHKCPYQKRIGLLSLTLLKRESALAE